MLRIIIFVIYNYDGSVFKTLNYIILLGLELILVSIIIKIYIYKILLSIMDHVILEDRKMKS